jgi:hypothetical protein
MMNSPTDHDIPTSSLGLPVEPGVAFGLLSDVLLNLVTAARSDPECDLPPSTANSSHARLP